MTDREFDRIMEWFFDSGNRLRTFASVWLCVATIVAVVCWFGAVLITGDDRDWYCQDHKVVATPTVYCQGNDLVRPTEWGPGTTAFLIGEITMLIGVLPIGLALGNRALLGTRGYSRAVRLRWTQSATKKALDERTGRLKAEALSEAAERETERIQRELDRLLEV